MKTSTIYRSLVTATPYLHSNLLVRQDGNTCGDLRGAYSNVQAPVCSGATSICTFAGSLQGCCDDQNVCQFYTTCVGSYAPETCIGSFCLPCPLQSPYCIKYNFFDSNSQRGYDGYSCAAFQATQTIFGTVTSTLEVLTTSSSSTAAASSSTDLSSSETLVLTRFNSTEPPSSSSTISSNYSSLVSTTPDVSSTVSSSLSSTATSATVPVSKSVSHTGAIAGGVVGGLAFLALIAVALICLKRRNDRREGRQRLPYTGQGVGEIQQIYDNDHARVPRWGE